jgi:hypothetical protein
MPAMTLRRLDPRLAVALWIALIYTSIPFVRRLREAFASRWPAELIGIGVIVTVIGALVVAVLRLRRQQRHLSTLDKAWLIAIALVAVVWTGRLMGQPEEAVHFVEYGVLGWLLHRALENRLPDPTVFLAATLIGLLVGTVDELIQWLVPGRFWDFRDIVLNGGAVALLQIAIWRMVEAPPQPVAAASIRLVFRLAAIFVALMTLCLAATPQRLAGLSDRIRLPKRLVMGSDAICEYGYRHAIDDRTAFRSRLSLQELAKSDIDLAESVTTRIEAARMSRRHERAYSSPVDNPFGYEFQVHIFSRNRNLQRARRQETGSAEHRRLMTTVWRQNLILETVFTNTLTQSSRVWGPRVRAEVESAQDPKASFVSPVGVHLITKLSEVQLRVLMVALLAALVAGDVFLARRSRPEVPPE